MLRILIADDLQSIACLTEAVIRNHFPKVDVIWAQNGEEAYHKTLEWQPQLVIMDLEMPRLNGVEAAVKIHSDARTRHIPILLSSGNTFTEEEEESYLSLFVAVLNKKELTEGLAPLIRNILHSPAEKPEEMTKITRPVLAMVFIQNFQGNHTTDRIMSFLNYWNRKQEQLARQFGGFRAASAPDVVMMVFPENDSAIHQLKAVQFIHQSRKLVLELNRRFEMQLILRGAVHQGEELLVQYQDATKRSMIIGDLVTLTRLLAESSDPMQISLSERIKSHASGHFRLIERSQRMICGHPFPLWYLHMELTRVTTQESVSHQNAYTTT